jgi:peptidoglycan/xylan/chitin deacetylase (PgdA/CDA1 family)
MRTVFRKISIVLLVGFFFLTGAPWEGPKGGASADSSFHPPVFVLLYHPWEEGFEDTFREHCIWLRQMGFETISIEILVDYMEGRAPILPPRPFLLTFDDGTIENYEIVYPILQEFGYQGTAFVMTGPPFFQSTDRKWWKEADRSNVLRIENHSHTHSLIFTGPKIIDFYSGENFEDYFLIKGMDRRLGAPIYELDAELVRYRYTPDRRLTDRCVNYVAQNGGEAFFKRENWREELQQVVENFRGSTAERGRYETDVQKGLRIQREIFHSKRMIEQAIGPGKKVDYFAYPWGIYDEGLIRQLEKSYRGAFTSDWGGNFPGDDPYRIKRVVVTSEMNAEDLAIFLLGE